MKTMAVGLTMLAMAACDGPMVGTDGVQQVPDAPGTPTLPDDPPRVPIIIHEPLAPFVPLEPAEVIGDNQVCAQADTLMDGTTHAKVVSSKRPSGCFETGLTTIGSYWRVDVGPHESALVQVSTTDTGGYLWLTAGPACDTDPGDDYSACRTAWTHQLNGLVISNPSDESASWVVAAVADHRMLGAAYELTLTRDALAPNASCDAPLPIEGSITGQRMSQSGIAPPAAPVGRMLFYSVELAPLTRVRASFVSDEPLGDVYPYFMDGCDEARWQSVGEVTNGGDVPKTVLLGVGTNYSAGPQPFTITLEATPIAPEASCANPTTLALGEAAEVDLEAGGQGPASCWCLNPARSQYVEVEVPAQSTVELVGDVAGGDAVGRVDFVELDSSCAEECGFNAVFGFDGKAVMPLVNETEAPITKTILVVGTAGWERADNHAPVTQLSVREGTK